MGKKLVIVESPAKAKTISNFLKGAYIVTASKGHIRDLDKFHLGVVITDTDVEPRYIISSDKKQTVSELRKYAANADEIYLATDEDREGEAISFHIAEVLGKNPLSLPRIAFHEITKSAIFHALEHPRKVDMNMVNSQQTRRILDRIVGFRVSGLLNKKLYGKMTAGRVQSPTLSMVVDRELEIMNFVPVKYYPISGTFETDEILGELYEFKGQKTPKDFFKEQSQADSVTDYLNSLSYVCERIEGKETKVNPLPPFTTSTLQQVASDKLGFGSERTMSAAQKLYEGVETHVGLTGVITYMRTDSLNIAEEALEACRVYIKNTYGDVYLSSSPKRYVTNSKGAQEAHEAIRPTNLDFTPERAKKFIDGDQLALYTLIYNRFLATQSTPAIFNTNNMFITSTNKEASFIIRGRTLVFDGFQKFTGVNSGDKILPNVEIGKVFKSCKIFNEEKETQPPGRYSEASLVKMMEKSGIGRPSTYASTIALLVKRNYVTRENKAIKATEKGISVIKALREHFPKIVDLHFTATLEEDLDKISSTGSLNWKEYLINYNKQLLSWIEDADKSLVSDKPEAIDTGKLCPKCGKYNLIERKGKFGMFHGCGGFPKCKYLEKVESAPIEFKQEGIPVEDQSCPVCGKGIVELKGRFGKYYACETGKDCTFKSSKLPIKGKSCPTCNGWIILRFGEEVCPKCNPYIPKDKNKFKKPNKK